MSLAACDNGAVSSISKKNAPASVDANPTATPIVPVDPSPDASVELNAKQNNAVKNSFINPVVAISAGRNHSLLLKADGSLWAWGSNKIKQLGDGTDDEIKLEPVKIMDGASLVSAGNYHSLAVKTDGSLWTWGNNAYGVLGIGSEERKDVPVKIMDGVAAIAAENHSLAVKQDGSLWAWGWNHDGQLGDGTDADKFTPVKIIDDVASVAVGYSHSLVVK